MTSEVVAINAEGVVLAADSALTLTAPGGGPTVYPSFPKIFDVSTRAPIGSMIYGQPRLAGVPWETLFSLYRQTDPDVSTVLTYTRGFDEWLDETLAVSLDMRRRAWQLGLQGVVERCLAESRTFVATRTDFNATLRASALAIRKVLRTAQPMAELPEGDPERQVQRQMAGNQKVYDTIIDGLLVGKAQIDRRTRELLHEVMAESTCRNHPWAISSGIVFAGVGLRQVMPAYTALGYSFEDTDIRRSQVRHESVLHGLDARIEPFGQTDEVNAFLGGFHPRLEEPLHSAWRDFAALMSDHVPDIAEACFTRLPADVTVTLPPETSDLMRKQFAEMVTSLWRTYYPTFMERAVPESRRRFTRPIERTVAALPRQTVAEIAEDLVRLTITRQRVSAEDVETVGGDIDVAVISRAEGFVWARRRVTP